jgi:hypothetical protein
MEIPHNREHRKDLRCRSRCSSPVLSTEGELGDFLARAEAIVNGTAAKALLSESRMNVTAKVRLQMKAGLFGVFIDREVCRS